MPQARTIVASSRSLDRALPHAMVQRGATLQAACDNMAVAVQRLPIFIMVLHSSRNA